MQVSYGAKTFFKKMISNLFEVLASKKVLELDHLIRTAT